MMFKFHCVAFGVLVSTTALVAFGSSLFERELMQLTERDTSFDCTPTPAADVIFILDASKSVGYNDFQKVLLFVSEFAKSFEIGQDLMRIGVATFSAKTDILFNLNEHFDVESIASAVEAHGQLPRKVIQGGRTNTSGSFYIAKHVMLTEENGARAGVPTTVILVTDGKPNEDVHLTIPYADELKDLGAMMFAIGVGHKVKEKYLYEIASEPKEEHMMKVNSANALLQLIDSVTPQICEEVRVCTEPQEDPLMEEKRQKVAAVQDLLNDLSSRCLENRCPACFTINEELGGCYRFGQDLSTLTWAEADSFCAENFGARAASILSQDEFDFFQENIAGSNKDFWTSGNDLGAADKFIWADNGLQVSGELTLAKNAENNRCVRMEDGNTDLTTVPCDQKNHVICKIKF